MQSSQHKKILAVDPGIERVGTAVLERIGNKETLLHSDCLRTSAKLPTAERIKIIGMAVRELIAEHAPDTLAIETLFFNTNQKTAMSVAEARGVIMYEASLANLAIEELSPLQVKVAVSGYGRSDKAQVKSMVQKLIAVKNPLALDDEFDAIAIALASSARRTF